MGGRRTLPAALAAWAIAALGLAAPAAAQDGPSRFAEGELVVRFAPGTDRGEQAAVRDDLGATLEERNLLPRSQLVELEPGAGVLDAAAAFERRPEVLYAEPNFLLELDGVPDDPLIFEQAGLHDTGQTFGDLDSVPPSFTGTYDADIDAPEAWNITTGSPQVTIAIADSGVDYTHPDLAPNVVGGHDFGADDPDPFPQGSDHGTHVAGIAGAVGNNDVGGAGVSWHSRLMPLKVSAPDGSIEAFDLADAFLFARNSGVQLVNASLGGADNSTLLRNAIDASPGRALRRLGGQRPREHRRPAAASSRSSRASTRRPTSSASRRRTTATSSRRASRTTGRCRWTWRRRDRASSARRSPAR